MNFFEKIETLLSDEQSVTITVRKNKNGDLTVAAIPKFTVDDKALKKLKPVTATGTPEQMDVHFLNQITGPLKSTMTLAQQVAEYEEHVDDVAKKTKMKEKETKDGQAAVDKCLAAADKHVEKKAFNKALAEIEKARKLGHKKAAVTKKEKEIKEKQQKEAPDIFTGPSAADNAIKTSKPPAKDTPVSDDKPVDGLKTSSEPPDQPPPPTEPDPAPEGNVKGVQPMFDNDQLDQSEPAI